MEPSAQLVALLDAAGAIVAAEDLDAGLARALQALAGELRADGGALLLYDAAADALRPRAAVGLDLATLKPLRMARGAGIAGKVLQQNAPLLLSSPQDVAAAAAGLDPVTAQLLTAARRGRPMPAGLCAAPLLCGSACEGVVLLARDAATPPFTAQDLALLQRAGGLLASPLAAVRLRAEVDALREEGRLRAEVISTLAHEMRTPLASIKGYASALLMDEVSFAPEAQREFLQVIDSECDLLQEIIQDFLESSAIDAGRMRIEPEPVLLARLVPAVVDEVAHRTQKHRFIISIAPDLPIIEADPERLAVVLRNLVGNAVKYSPDGGLVVIRGERRAGEVVISVADQGLGIAPEHLNRLFDKFFRIHSETGRRIAGSGLGLPIARSIVEGHGGRIWAESQLGKGSTFFVALPLPRADEAGPANGGASDGRIG